MHTTRTLALQGGEHVRVGRVAIALAFNRTAAWPHGRNITFVPRYAITRLSCQCCVGAQPSAWFED
jgi:hypothetical protein